MCVSERVRDRKRAKKLFLGNSGPAGNAHTDGLLMGCGCDWVEGRLDLSWKLRITRSLGPGGYEIATSVVSKAKQAKQESKKARKERDCDDVGVMR